MSSLPLVLVHGFMGGSKQWELLRNGLSKQHEIIAVDLPGFGKNANMDAPDTINGFAQYVLDYLTGEGIEKFHLLGHSMGGMIVQEMTAIAPERVTKLVLFGTAAAGDLPGRFETFETSKKRVQEDGVLVSARRISATWFLEYEAAAEFENCAALAERSSLQAMLSSLDAMKAWSRVENLPKISCPVLIIWGEADRTYRWPKIEELWTTIPNASLAVLPNCSHAAHMEKPELFNQVTDDFLGRKQ